jgi:hypothetical protein
MQTESLDTSIFLPSLFSLHSDLLGLIFGKLDVCSRLAVRYSCRRFHSLIKPVKDSFSINFSYHAAELGYLSLLKWAWQRGVPFDALSAATAAGNDHLQVLQWARENGCPWNDDICKWAAQCGRLEVVKWLRDNGAHWNLTELRNVATGEVMEWLNDRQSISTKK